MQIFHTVLPYTIIILAAAIATGILGTWIGGSFDSPFSFLALLGLLFIGALTVLVWAEHASGMTLSLAASSGAVLGFAGLILVNVENGSCADA